MHIFMLFNHLCDGKIYLMVSNGWIVVQTIFPEIMLQLS